MKGGALRPLLFISLYPYFNFRLGLASYIYEGAGGGLGGVTPSTYPLPRISKNIHTLPVCKSFSSCKSFSRAAPLFLSKRVVTQFFINFVNHNVT